MNWSISLFSHLRRKQVWEAAEISRNSSQTAECWPEFHHSPRPEAGVLHRDKSSLFNFPADCLSPLLAWCWQWQLKVQTWTWEKCPFCSIHCPLSLLTRGELEGTGRRACMKLTWSWHEADMKLTWSWPHKSIKSCYLDDRLHNITASITHCWYLLI